MEEENFRTSTRITRTDTYIKDKSDFIKLRQIFLGYLRPPNLLEQFIVRVGKYEYFQFSSPSDLMMKWERVEYGKSFNLLKWKLEFDGFRMVADRSFYYITGPKFWIDRVKKELISYLKERFSSYLSDTTINPMSALGFNSSIYIVFMLSTFPLLNRSIYWLFYQFYFLGISYSLSSFLSSIIPIMVPFIIILYSPFFFIVNKIEKLNPAIYASRIKKGKRYKGYGLGIVLISAPILILPIFFIKYFPLLAPFISQYFYLIYTLLFGIIGVVPVIVTIKEYYERRENWVDFE